MIEGRIVCPAIALIIIVLRRGRHDIRVGFMTFVIDAVFIGFAVAHGNGDFIVAACHAECREPYQYK